MGFGSFFPFPRRFGGGLNRLQAITNNLNAARGNAYDTSTWGSSVSIENRAIARFLDARWATNDRAASQFDPTRTQDLIPRWQRIFNIFSLPTDPASTQRNALAFKWAAIGKSPTYNQIVADLTTLMGPVFVGIVHTSSANGRVIYPGFNSVVIGTTITAGGSAYGSPPTVTFSAPGSLGGITATGTAVLTADAVTSITLTNPGYGYADPPTVTFGTGAATAYATTNANPYDVSGQTIAHGQTGESWVDWASGVAFIAIQVQQVTGYTINKFQSAINAGMTYLDGALPGADQFGWFVTNSGFYLDQQNLSWQAFDS